MQAATSIITLPRLLERIRFMALSLALEIDRLARMNLLKVIEPAFWVDINSQPHCMQPPIVTLQSPPLQLAQPRVDKT